MNVIVRCCGSMLMLAAAGCSLTPAGPPPATATSPPPAGQMPGMAPSVVPAVSPPTVPGADYRDPDEVCLRFTIALYSTDTTRDPGPAAAWQRAAAYASGQLAAQSPAAGQDGRWDLWHAHRARLAATAVALTPDPETANTTTAAGRAARVTATPVGRDGWHGPAETSTVWCDLTRTGSTATWRVADFRILAGNR